MIRQVIDIARGAGKIVMKQYGGTFKINYKKDQFDPVTSVDLESNTYLTKQLQKHFPKDQILSEETKHTVKNYAGRVWVIDPIDGTKGFIKKADFSIIIGLLQDGKPSLGVVYDPVHDVVFYAEKNKGAFMLKNGRVKRLKVRKTKTLPDAVLVTRFFNQNKWPLDPVVEKMKVRKRIPLHSTGLKLAYLAAGKADVVIGTSPRVSKWDTCGSQVILEEAGGMVTDLSGKPLDYTHKSSEWHYFLASNGFLHGKVLHEIRRLAPSK